MKPRVFSTKLALGTVGLRVKVATAAIAVVLILLLLVAGVLAAPATTNPKQAYIQQVAATEAAHASLPHAQKQHVAPATSCPVTLALGIHAYRPMGGFRDLQINNFATIVLPDGAAYVISAGALQADPQQGILVVEPIERDPCADQAAGRPFQSQATTFRRPTRDGALTITAASGNTVTFATPSGVTGSFNFLTGQFS